MLRLLVPLAGIVSFFLLSFVTVRLVKPKQPRVFFLGYALLLLVAAVYLYTRFWPLETLDDRVGLLSCLLLQMLMCLTMWNAFYSLLWGFSGSMMYDVHNVAHLRDRERLVLSYQGPDPLRDRILARRLPNLAGGGWVAVRGDELQLRPKGRVLALGTLAAFKVFSLGMGGGVK